MALLTVGAGSAAAGAGGGVSSPEPPVVRDVNCVETCADVRVAAEGSRVALTGRNLGGVKRVVFRAADGVVRARARNARARRVEAIVPEGAVTGRPKAVDAYGGADRSPERLRIVDRSRIPEGGPFALRSAEATPHKVFFDARRKAAVTYTFSGDGPTDVRVDVIDRRDGSIVASFRQRDREPFTPNTARWSGALDSGGVATKGDYRFRVGAVSGGKTETTKGAAFKLRDHKFPVRARHGYGDGFGAGRGHQGADVFARCGAKIVAARGGRVTFRDYHSAAGHYVVISGRRTNHDYMYAHLQRRSKFGPGDRVRTGDVIGTVGETGNASGCHLHFEIWRGAWQQGGTPLASVMRKLKRWDGWS